MIHKYISSKIIIDKIYDEFNIQSDDFVSRLSTWTLNVLRASKIKQVYILENIALDFDNYKICIPQKIDRIYDVIINGYKAIPDFSNNTTNKTKFSSEGLVYGFDGNVYKSSNLMQLVTTNDTSKSDIIINEDKVFGIRELSNKPIDKANYKVSNGWIHTNIENGTCEILCGAIPYEYDDEMETMFPLIPDNEDLHNTIMYYCLKNMLQRGYHHAVLSLQSNNPYTNPALAYDKFMFKARNSCNAISPSAKKSLSSILNISLI